jgi:DNA repair protein RecO (recombination protein O)
MSESRRERIYKSEAIVIGRMDLGEVDRILTLFTPQRGKLRVIAKGIRRPKSKLAPHVEYFTRCQLLLAKGRDLDVLTGAETIDPFWSIRGDLEAFGHASHLVELLNQLTKDQQAQAGAYDLLARSLRLLAEGVDPFAVTRHYELGLLTILGFRPQLYRCVGCEREIAAEANGLSARLGGMVCPMCASADLSAVPVSVNAQKYIRTLDRSGLSAAAQLRPDAATAGEIERALGQYLRHHAERDLSSLRVLRSIREGLPAGAGYNSTK